AWSNRGSGGLRTSAAAVRAPPSAASSAPRGRTKRLIVDFWGAVPVDRAHGRPARAGAHPRRPIRLCLFRSKPADQRPPRVGAEPWEADGHGETQKGDETSTGGRAAG